MNQLPTESEILECLQRSGYLLEGRIIRKLSDIGLFVEPSQSMLDKRTGVSRELDLVAESWKYTPERPRTSVKTTFVVEVINNSYPVVLLTERPSSPDSPIEDYICFKLTPPDSKDPHPFFDKVDLYKMKGVYEWEVYSQYCGFTKKKDKDQLMASHHEDLHTAIRKTSEFCLVASRQYHSWMDSNHDDYWRIFQWCPTIVLKDSLYILRSSNVGEISLEGTGHAILEHNFHYEERPTSAAIHFVVESYLSEFVERCLETDDAIESHVFELRKSSGCTSKSEE